MSRNLAKRRRKRWFLLLFIAVLAVLFVKPEWIGRLIYPISFTDEIKSSAESYGIDPLLIAAIIRVESNFKENAVSPKGAVGIMQLMPETAQWIIEKGSFRNMTVEDAACCAEASIRLGTWYVRELYRQFDGNLPVVLAAYNAGPSRVRTWLNDQIWDGRLQTVEKIPYGETRHYVRRVMYYYKKYTEVYGSI
jgi:soluble lytic murein transglycosylase